MPFFGWDRGGQSRTSAVINGRRAGKSIAAAVEAQKRLAQGDQVFLTVDGELCRVVGVNIELSTKE